MPMRNVTSRTTAKAENTRPRMLARHVPLQEARRAMDMGALRKPVTVTRTIATMIGGPRRRGRRPDPMATVAMTIHGPSRSRSPKRAISRLPITKPTEVKPSWRPYSNSVAWSARIAIGRSSTFHRPNEKQTGSGDQEACAGAASATGTATPSFRLSTIDADRRRLLLGRDARGP